MSCQLKHYINISNLQPGRTGINREIKAMDDKKISYGPEISLLAPVWVIGSYDQTGKANMMAAAWGGICCSRPPCVTISLRQATCTYRNIMARKAFTVNLPSRKYIKETDYFGCVSGKEEDKLAAAGLTPIQGSRVDAPYLKEFPVAVECKLVQTVDLGMHTMFIGEILDVKAEKDVAESKEAWPGMLIFDPKRRYYYGMGKNCGKAFSIGQQPGKHPAG